MDNLNSFHLYFICRWTWFKHIIKHNMNVSEGEHNIGVTSSSSGWSFKSATPETSPLDVVRCAMLKALYTQKLCQFTGNKPCVHFYVRIARWELQPLEVSKDKMFTDELFRHYVLVKLMYDTVYTCIYLCVCVCGDQLGVKALTVEDLLQAQKEISAHNRQLKEQTKQLERDMALLRDHSLLLVRLQGYVVL